MPKHLFWCSVTVLCAWICCDVSVKHCKVDTYIFDLIHTETQVSEKQPMWRLYKDSHWPTIFFQLSRDNLFRLKGWIINGLHFRTHSQCCRMFYKQVFILPSLTLVDDSFLFSFPNMKRDKWDDFLTYFVFVKDIFKNKINRQTPQKTAQRSYKVYICRTHTVFPDPLDSPSPLMTYTNIYISANWSVVGGTKYETAEDSNRRWRPTISLRTVTNWKEGITLFTLRYQSPLLPYSAYVNKQKATTTFGFMYLSSDLNVETAVAASTAAVCFANIAAGFLLIPLIYDCFLLQYNSPFNSTPCALPLK